MILPYKHSLKSRRELIMYKNIVVAVGPSFSEAALSTAIAYARESNARLTMLHVIDQTPWWSGAFAETLCDTPALMNQLALNVRQSSEKMLRDAGIEAVWQARHSPRDGASVARVIADSANALDADLIVLGARRRGLLAMGIHHVRNVVCRRARCEVLVATERAPQMAEVIVIPDAKWQACHA
jgi:nucleotide-binding universal stress UspA family protein